MQPSSLKAVEDKFIVKTLMQKSRRVLNLILRIRLSTQRTKFVALTKLKCSLPLGLQ